MRYFISLLLLVSIGAVISEKSWAGRSKLEQKLRAVSDDDFNKLVNKMRDQEEKCEKNVGFDAKKCLAKKKVEEILKETPCCQSVLMSHNINAAHEEQSQSPVPYPTDNLALFKDIF